MDTTSNTPDGSTPWLVGAALAIWFIGAVAAGVTGGLRALPPAAVGTAVWTTVLLLALPLRRSGRLRAWAMSVDFRSLVPIHFVRFVGIYLLMLHARGILPKAFAIHAGWGDILVALTAIGVAMLRPERNPRHWRLAIVWNIAGMLDMLLVVLTAIELTLQNSRSMQGMIAFPLSLLPTFFVPMIILSHIVIFIRLRHAEAAPGTPPKSSP